MRHYWPKIMAWRIIVSPINAKVLVDTQIAHCWRNLGPINVPQWEGHHRNQVDFYCQFVSTSLALSRKLMFQTQTESWINQTSMYICGVTLQNQILFYLILCWQTKVQDKEELQSAVKAANGLPSSVSRDNKHPFYHAYCVHFGWSQFSGTMNQNLKTKTHFPRKILLW